MEKNILKTFDFTHNHIETAKASIDRATDNNKTSNI
jgi:hypothetical protein